MQYVIHFKSVRKQNFKIVSISVWLRQGYIDQNDVYNIFLYNGLGANFRKSWSGFRRRR
jgi:hypothetical protein